MGIKKRKKLVPATTGSALPSFYIEEEVYDSPADELRQYGELDDEPCDDHFDELEATMDLTKLIKEGR